MSRIISRASGKPTKLIRVMTDSTNHVLAAQKHGVKIGWLVYRCEPSKEPPHFKQWFKCQKYGHSAIECKNEQRCLRCSGQHTAKNNAPNQRKMPNAKIVVVCTHLCTKDAPPTKTQLLKQQRKNKISSTQQWQKDKSKCYNQTQLSQQ